ncbi:MFS transporter [Arthrobacter flavus]|uniref:Multidrug efflux pump Tap n=1 Tax=Arthrobacter flavus TaxID=95172 RepID=A0ABW4Q7L8_9MICC
MTTVGGISRRPRTSAIGLLSADWLSVTGNSIVGIAIPWLVLQRTGNAALAGLIVAAAIVPLILSALLGGAVVDRIGRKISSILADLLSAAAVAAIPLIDLLGNLGLGVLAVLVAVGAVFDGPGMAAREALTVDVSRASGISLVKLTSYREALQGIGQLAGPGLAGLLIALIGPLQTLWISAAMFILALTIIALTVPKIPAERPARSSPENTSHPNIGRRYSYWASVREGISYLWKDRTLRAVGITAALLLMFLVPLETVVLQSYFSTNGDSSGLAIVLTAFAVGGIAGSLSYALVATRVRRRLLLIGALSATTISLALLALLPSLPILAVISALIGFSAGPVNPLTSVIIQERTPDHLRGRIIGNITSLALMGAPIGLLLAGPIVELFGVPTAILAIAAGCAAATIHAALSRAFRTLDTPN